MGLNLRMLGSYKTLMIVSILAIVLCSAILLYAGNKVFPDKVYIYKDKIKIVQVPQREFVPQEVPVLVTIDVPVYRDKIVEVNKTIVLDLSKERLADCIRLSTDNGELLDCGAAGIYKWAK